MSDSDERALRWIVTGRVQGVSYRYFTQDAASRLGLSGWVRNLADGSVEAWVRGPAEAIEALRAHLVEGPPMSRVDAVTEEELPAGTELAPGFSIRY